MFNPIPAVCEAAAVGVFAVRVAVNGATKARDGETREELVMSSMAGTA